MSPSQNNGPMHLFFQSEYRSIQIPMSLILTYLLKITKFFSSFSSVISREFSSLPLPNRKESSLPLPFTSREFLSLSLLTCKGSLLLLRLISKESLSLPLLISTLMCLWHGTFYYSFVTSSLNEIFRFHFRQKIK